MIQYCVFVFLGLSIHHWFRLSILFDGYLWPTKPTFWITLNHQSTCGWVFARFCKYTVRIYIYIQYIYVYIYIYIYIHLFYDRTYISFDVRFVFIRRWRGQQGKGSPSAWFCPKDCSWPIRLRSLHKNRRESLLWWTRKSKTRECALGRLPC